MQGLGGPNAIHRVAAEGISFEQAVDDLAIARIEEILSELRHTAQTGGSAAFRLS